MFAGGEEGGDEERTEGRIGERRRGKDVCMGKAGMIGDEVGVGGGVGKEIERGERDSKSDGCRWERRGEERVSE